MGGVSGEPLGEGLLCLPKHKTDSNEIASNWIRSPTGRVCDILGVHKTISNFLKLNPNENCLFNRLFEGYCRGNVKKSKFPLDIGIFFY